MTLQTPTPARRAGSLALLARAASLSACSLVPTYERPAAPVASQWPSQDGMAAAPGESAAHVYAVFRPPAPLVSRRASPAWGAMMVPP